MWFEDPDGEHPVARPSSQFDIYEDSSISSLKPPVSSSSLSRSLWLPQQSHVSQQQHPNDLCRSSNNNILSHNIIITGKENIERQKQEEQQQQPQNSSKRKASSKMSESHGRVQSDTSSKRKFASSTSSQVNDLEDIIRQGLTSHILRLQDCLSKYEMRAPGAIVIFDGLSMSYEDSEDGNKLYSWLLGLGFNPLLNHDHRVLCLPKNKIAQVKAALSKHSGAGSSQLLKKNDFFEANKSNRRDQVSKKKSYKSSSSSFSSRTPQSDPQHELQESASTSISTMKSSRRHDRLATGHDTISTFPSALSVQSHMDDGDVSLSLSLQDANDLFDNREVSSLMPSVGLAATRPHVRVPSTVESNTRAFGKSTGTRFSQQPKKFTADAFGASFKLGATEGVSVLRTCSDDTGSSRSRRRSKSDPATSKFNKDASDLSLEISSEDEVSFGAPRPLSTSSMSSSSSSMSSLLLSSDGQKLRVRCNSDSNPGATNVPRKSPRSRRGTPSPTANRNEAESVVSDSVIKKFNSIAIEYSVEKDANLRPFSHLRGAHTTFPFSSSNGGDSVVSFSGEEIQSEMIDGKDFPDETSWFAPKPSFSRSNSSSLEMSMEEHSDLKGYGSGSSLLASPPNFLSESAFSPSVAPPPPTIPPKSRQVVEEGNTSFSSSNLSTTSLMRAKSQDSENGRGLDYPPNGRTLKRNKTEPPPYYASSLNPQTPECNRRDCFSQNDLPDAKIISFSTPQGATTNHTSGLGYDFLLTEEAFGFEIEQFTSVFNTKPPESPVIRESVSPHIFSALSNRKYSSESFANSDEKEIAKVKKNKAFLKRMSSGGSDKTAGGSSSFNPSTTSKAKRGRKSIISNQSDMVSFDSKVHWNDLDMKGGHASLDTNSFRGVVIGGVYENCFDDNIPVVSAPSVFDKRVVGVQLVSDIADPDCVSLKIFILVSGDQHVKAVSLGTRWVCYKISTGGFLVTKSEILPYQSCVCYFLPMHPRKWAMSSGNLSPKDKYGHALFSEISPKSLTDTSIIHADGIHFPVTFDHFAADESKIYPEDEEDNLGNEDDDVDHEDREVCRQLHISMGTTMSPNSSVFDEDHANSSKLSFFNHEIDDDRDSILQYVQQATQLSNSDADGEGVVFLHLNTEGQGEDNTLNLSMNAMHLQDDDDYDEKEITAISPIDWNNSTVLSNVMPFLLDDRTSIAEIGTVSKSWALECCKIIAAELSTPGACQRLDQSGWVRFMLKFNQGKFLSAGACKDVFCIYSPNPSQACSPRLEAVSVMDMIDLRERNVGQSISRELEISILCSSLVTLNVCPNLLQIYSIFQALYPPSNSLWRRGRDNFPSPSLPSPSQSALSKEVQKLSVGEYQYIRMEYCCSGDLEEVIRARKTFDPQRARSMLFQMCFALYACREQLSLRHYDIKLLNFFCTSAESLFENHNCDQKKSLTDNDTDCVNMSFDTNYISVGFGEHVYCIPVNTDASMQDLVKLADFGTSSVGTSTLSMPITVHQFTTLENTPPEYLFLGSYARECFTADTFCLGLCIFHVLTGEEPYEEHLKDVHCPPLLLGKLKNLWRTSNPSNQYRVIAEVIESLDAPKDLSENAPTNILNVLYDTFYRYMVLFDLDTSSGDSPYPPSNPVLSAAIDCLGLNTASQGGNTGRVTKLKSECIQQFTKDRSKWSIRFGTHSVIKRVRENLDLLGPGASELLFMMVNLDPSKRCSLHEAITSPLFYPLRLPESTSVCFEDVHGDSLRSFMHYKNKPFLPIL